MNRRGNGLSAETYAPLVDLAPHLADAMLAALRDAGVAAYATAPNGLVDLTGEAATGDVLDRLYVDVDMKPAAESILRAHLARLRDAGGRGSEGERPDGDLAEPAPRDDQLDQLDPFDARDADGTPPGAGDSPTGTAERDEDAIWAEIVAGYDSVPEGDRVPWPDQENIHEPPKPPEEGDDRTGRIPRARVIKPAEPAELPPDEDEGHYVPPPPPPLPAADPLTKGAWIALVGGPVYLLITVILDWDVPGWAAFLAVAAFIGGFVTLVLRMGDEPRDPDDGAVV
ncbi:hypothetical protein [Actinomadura xylanilytica]|uniref:hypothetical protein n=1 Tax=Actinomadura xylanilytica TaxID=887459 RepID=UPI00255AC4F0|nr:hypothetical protein [Actinomadura xylanilytica]MDL4771167.1 hypothetical protein [Actinomadura xylanilytica]